MAVASAPRTLRYGNLELDSCVLVAPMVGITDVPFRQIAREMGAGLVSTEMVAADAVIRRIPATMRCLDFPAHTRPVAAQLVGCDAGIMADAARICADQGADVVDVNLGCPVRKVTGRGSGAALARDVSATAEILGAMVCAVDVPVTAKMRLGWDHQTINAPELAKALQDVGVAAVAVHGRTRNQGYRGLADWDEIARVRQAVSIPVIGSGDVSDPVKIREQIENGVVDGVIVARGMLGNYSLLDRAVRYVATGELKDEPTFAQRVAAAQRHVEMLIDYYGPERALRNGRKYVSWTIKGCAGAAKLRALVQGMDSREALDDIWQRALEAGLGSDGWFQPVFTSGEG
jgi:tRNA-dihydrouridine synthase B